MHVIVSYYKQTLTSQMCRTKRSTSGEQTHRSSQSNFVTKTLKVYPLEVEILVNVMQAPITPRWPGARASPGGFSSSCPLLHLCSLQLLFYQVCCLLHACISRVSNVSEVCCKCFMWLLQKQISMLQCCKIRSRCCRCYFWMLRNSAPYCT
jgi:hypothetical protein